MESSPNNTYIFDPESSTEMARLINQDRVATRAMNGPLSGIPDPSILKNILDLGCGPGGWALDVAFALPDADVEGVDVSRTMVNYANARAHSQHLLNASFGIMDLTKPLEFPDNSFDLVNARFLVAVLKRDMWPAFLSECTRVLRPGGLLRLTEVADSSCTTSQAVNQLLDLTMCAAYHAGYGFSEDHALSLLPRLLSLFREYGYEQKKPVAHVIDYSAKTESWADTYHNIQIVGYQMKPLLIKLGLISEEAFDELYQQALIDIQTDAFCGMGHFTTLLGQKSAH
jgi:ubiquinone/menaquinone biosynthesis C-methylase UbiE